MKRILTILALLFASPVMAQQPVLQSGLVTPGHAPVFITNGVIGDAGTAQSPVLTSIGTVGQGNTICANSGPQTAPYNQICIGANLNSPAQIVLQNFAGATAQNLQFVVNGAVTTLPSGPLLFQVGGFTNGNCLKASGTAGGVADAGTTCGGGGGGGSPGGSNSQVQYNNAGTFGGVTGTASNGTSITFASNDLLIQGLSSGTTALASANASGTNFTITFPAATGTVALTSNIPVASVANADGTLTISPTTGSVIASLALGHANTWVAAQTFTNSDLLLLGSSTGVTTFTSANAGSGNFTQTVQAVTDTLVDRGTPDILTNKTLASSTNSLGGNTIVVGSDATGDIWYRNSSGIFTRLGIGTSAQVLTVSGGLPSWQTTAGGGAICTTTALSLQYNNAGAFGCVADWTSDGTSLTGALGTITTNVKALTITGTFNSAGTTFDAPLFMNITNTASAVGSLLMDIQLGGTSILQIGRPTTGTDNSLVLNGGGFGSITDRTSIIFNNIGTSSFSSQFAMTSGSLGSQTQHWAIGTDANANKGDTFYIFNNQNSTTPLYLIGASTRWISVPANWAVGFSSNSAFPIANQDTSLYRDAAASVLALSNANTNGSATSLRVYNTTDAVGTNTAPTNYERFAIDWITNTNVATIGTQAGGSGSTRNMEFVIGGINKLDYGVTNAGGWTHVGTQFMPNLAALSAATTAWVCWTTGTGAISEDSASCISSLRALKHDIMPFAGATAELVALKPSTFEWNKPIDYNQSRIQLGFIAEDVAAVDSKLASYAHDGSLHGWQEEGMIALLVKGFQEQQQEIERLKQRIH